VAKFNIPRLEGESDRDFRRRYHREWERQTRIAKGLNVRSNEPKGTCSVDGCDVLIHSKGMCARHYRAKWGEARKHRTDLPPSKREHPLYVVWHERKSRGGLCEAWLDFDGFVAGVGERPSPDHYLRRLDRTKDYGPDNFEWKHHLKRGADESVKDFNARKWQSRKVQNPKFERRRHLVRKFGISNEQYEEMLEAQNDLCAICKKPETRFHGQTKEVCLLAVDHDHSTGQVRDLLCWRCNTTIGRVEESVELLRSMITYLELWGSPMNPGVNRPPPILAPGSNERLIDTEWGPLNPIDAARKAGLAPRTVISRIRYGWKPEDLLQPLRRPGYRKPKIAPPEDPGTVL